MAFRTYPDKSSLRKKNSRTLQGGTAERTDNFIGWWERDEFPTDDVTDTVYKIKKVYEFKPDMISYDFYGRNDLGWLILQYNNIVDINEELAAGKTIILPSKSRVFYQFLVKPVEVRRISS